MPRAGSGGTGPTALVGLSACPWESVQGTRGSGTALCPGSRVGVPWEQAVGAAGTEHPAAPGAEAAAAAAGAAVWARPLPARAGLSLIPSGQEGGNAPGITLPAQLHGSARRAGRPVSRALVSPGLPQGVPSRGWRLPGQASPSAEGGREGAEGSAQSFESCVSAATSVSPSTPALPCLWSGISLPGSACPMQ